jgi:hypothetical protein
MIDAIVPFGAISFCGGFFSIWANAAGPPSPIANTKINSPSILFMSFLLFL